MCIRDSICSGYCESHPKNPARAKSCELQNDEPLCSSRTSECLLFPFDEFSFEVDFEVTTDNSQIKSPGEERERTNGLRKLKMEYNSVLQKIKVLSFKRFPSIRVVGDS